MRRLSPQNLRSAWWTLRAVRRLRGQVGHEGLDAIRLPRVPAVSAEAEGGMNAVLRRTGATCLVRSFVRQAWYAEHGSRRDLVIGVTAPADGFEAHAWLEGDPPLHHQEFAELHRRPAPL